MRYIILVVVAFPAFWIFYFIFTPLTSWITYFILDLFYKVSLSGIIISINNCAAIELIRACVAGSAYYLLLIFNLTIPNIKIIERLKMILFAFFTFFILNIIRIVILSVMHVSESSLFDITHQIFWYFLSIVFVVLIWIIEIKLFNIKQIPLYSDIKNLYTQSSLNSK